MSLDLFTGFFGGSYGAYGGLTVTQAADSAPDGKVTPLDPTERYYGHYLGGYGAYPGFDNAPPWSVPLAWQIRRDSTVVLAHTIITVPIIAGTQVIEIARDDALAEKMKAAAEEDLLPTVEEWLPGMLEDINFGSFLQEIVWGFRGGRIVPVDFPSILPGNAVIYCDKYRKFAGYEINGQYRDARYGLLSVNEPHVDPIFGYARTQNVREEWWRKRKSEENADKTERKASGIQMGIGMPIGASFVDAKNNPIFPQKVAEAIINAAVQGQTFTFPLCPFTKADITRDPKLADIPAVKIESFDWGNIGPALDAHLARRDGLNIAIMRGMKRPEREAMQGTHGTNAESDTQGQIGTLDSEYVARMKMRQASKQILDRWAIANFGVEAAGVLRFAQSPLSDPQQLFLQKASLAILADASTGPAMQANVDQRRLLDRVEMPMVSEEDAATALAEQEQEKQKQQDLQSKQFEQRQQQNGESMKGSENGNGNPRMELSAEVAERLAGYFRLGHDE